ncbi:MAG: RNA 2',3'-cyclic phosphodiesterase [Robiginitomaculum sp.]|nr:RNA 2',3'-cyclic phosphodiesterase [Robiginitomaculum sp.]
MRLFTALNIPKTIADQLFWLQAGIIGAHWRPPENFHITLQFYGDVEPKAAIDLEHALQDIPVPVLNLKIAGLGAFGGKQPFALWAGVAGADEEHEERLRELSRACYQAAAQVGIAVPARKYTPHLTLAYCKGVTDVQAARYFEQFGGFAPHHFTASQFQLYSSQLGKGPANYRVEASFGSDGGYGNVGH